MRAYLRMGIARSLCSTLFHRQRPGQPARGLPSRLNCVMGQLRIRQRHLAVVSCCLRLVAPMDKLGIHNHSKLVQLVIKMGLVQLE